MCIICVMFEQEKLTKTEDLDENDYDHLVNDVLAKMERLINEESFEESLNDFS